ncbi:hypothetical protein EVA_06901 [gut metagenome]|uniref:Uncharacterized protein n=1 Tax=gut metagenome TaxID=749906 RepID=J9GWH9_9ZZZZ
MLQQMMASCLRPLSPSTMQRRPVFPLSLPSTRWISPLQIPTTSWSS